MAIAGLLAACALGHGAAAASAVGVLPQKDDGGEVYASDQAIVRFEPGTKAVERREARNEAGVAYEGSLELPRAEVVAIDGSVRAAVRRLEGQPGVAYAQPNFRYEALAVPAPNDTLFGELWGLSDPAAPDPGVSALEAWEESEGGGEVIAVVDTGVDLTHPDLAGNLWANPLEDVGIGGLDEDLNGKVDDVHGYDFVDDDGDPDDYQFHGTHVAGTAAAVAGNSEGIAGVAPAAQIMAVRVLDGDGSGFTSDIADGIAYAAEEGAGVINLSLGGPAGGDQATEDAIELAGAEGAVVVAAAGNEGVDNDAEPHTPCALPQANLICVAALARSGGIAGFSNYGSESVDLAAPGTSILSAKTDYGAPLFADGFEANFSGIWEAEASSGGIEWGTSDLFATGSKSAADSPAPGQVYAPEAESFLFTAAPIDLTGERGCRVHFRTMYEIEESFDGFYAGALSHTPLSDSHVFDGTSAGYPTGFSREEASVSRLDGRTDAHPFFAVASDESIELDGAYVDDVRLICRDETYVDAEVSSASYDQPNVGNYVRFQGTSMAAPHLAGVVALVRSAAPGLAVEQVVDAVLEGTSAIPSPSIERPTATFGIADACKAIAVATGGDVAATCPGSSPAAPPPPPPPPPPTGGGGGGTPPPPAPIAPGTAPAPGPPAQAPAADTKAPRAFFRKRPPKVVRTRSRRARVVLRFGSSEAGVAFVCKVDSRPWRRCSRRLVRRFGGGRHAVRVKARDRAGNVSRKAAVYRFAVKVNRS